MSGTMREGWDIALFEKVSQWFDTHRDEFVNDLLEWISIPSVSEQAQDTLGQPFGPEVARMFDHVLTRAQGLGFRTETHDGYAISILFGDSTREIGLISHLDVVPAGENWVFAPFAPFERDGFVIGRGGADNKGAALVDLYLLRAFRDLGVKLNRTLRIIYGGGEETGMLDMEYYVRHYPVPDLSIITDGGFPVNYAQKGGLNLAMNLPTGSVLAGFSAGVAENAVPATAAITLPLDAASVEYALAALSPTLRDDLSISGKDKNSVVIARGQSGHAAFPENTRNPIPILLSALINAHLLKGEDLKAAQVILRLLSDPWGVSAGIASEDKSTGKLTVNGGLIRPVGEGIELSLDIRYPIVAQPETIKRVLEDAAAEIGGTLRVTRHARPMHLDKEGPLVTLLQKSFDEIAETKTEPYSMGGGTHARIVPRSVTYGPGFARLPGLTFRGVSVDRRPDFIPLGHGFPHGPDEYVEVDNLKRGIGIYAATIPYLDRWLEEDGQSFLKNIT